jgi:hypothetical protein
MGSNPGDEAGAGRPQAGHAPRLTPRYPSRMRAVFTSPSPSQPQPQALAASRLRAAALGALVALAAAACGGAAAPRTAPAAPSPGVAPESARVDEDVAVPFTTALNPRKQVERHRRFELSWVASDSMPAPRATFVAPSGRVIRVDSFESLGLRRVRFAPREVGTYRYEVRDSANVGGEPVLQGRFESTPSRDPGAVHIDPGQPHRLVFEDGTPFFVLGENRINIYDPSWNFEHKSIDEYVKQMADEGMTTLRVFIGSDAVPVSASDTRGLGCLEPKLGQFDETVARRFDAIFAAAEAHGIYVVLTAFAVGFTPHDEWKTWEQNPYSVERGGPAHDPNEFFTLAAARAAAERRLRYIVARWGYSTHLLAIDLLNEPEWDGAIPESKWVPWAESMAASVRAADPYEHLVTVGSVGLQWNIDGDEKPLYAGTGEDLVQWHLYGQKTYDPRANAIEMARKVRETYGYGKPVFCGEFAYGGEDPALYDHTHDGIWAATFAGGGALAHSAPPFNVDSDEPMTPARGHHFRVLSDFLRSLDWSRRLEPDDRVRVARPEDAHVFTLGSSDYKAFWLLGPAHGYGAAVEGASLAIDGLPAGRYRATFRDDVTGALLGRVALVVHAGTATVDVPPFVRHVAGTVEPER